MSVLCHVKTCVETVSDFDVNVHVHHALIRVRSLWVVPPQMPNTLELAIPSARH